MHTKLPNINFLQKLTIFLLSDFRRIREEVSKSGVLWPICLRRCDQMVYSIFSKSCLSRHQGFQKIPKWKKVFIKMGSLPTVITNSFRIPVVQKLENIFNHIFSFSFALGIILFLEASTKFMMTKSVQNKSIHVNANIKVMFTFLKKHIHEWKHS